MSAASRARHQQPAVKMATKTESATRRTAAEGGTREKLGRGAEKKTDTRQNGFETPRNCSGLAGTGAAAAGGAARGMRTPAHLRPAPERGLLSVRH